MFPDEAAVPSSDNVTTLRQMVRRTLGVKANVPKIQPLKMLVAEANKTAAVSLGSQNPNNEIMLLRNEIAALKKEMAKGRIAGLD